MSTEDKNVTVCPERADVGGEDRISGVSSAADIRHNLIVLVLIDCIWVFGAAEMLLAAGPLYVYLHASNTLIGLIGSSQILGLLGVFLSPFITRRFPVKKLYLLIVHVPYIGPWGIIGIGLILSRRLGLSNEWLLGFVVAMNCVSGFFAGFVTLPHQEYVAACVPMSHRGRLNGYSNATGSGLALISNALAGWILLTMAKPMAFGWLYVMTWLICQGGYVLALLGREQRTPVERAPKPWSKEMVLSALRDKPYMRVIAVYTIYVIFFMPVVWMFLAIYGFRDLKMIAATAAALGITQKIATLLTSSHIGHLIDKFSAKRILLYLPFAFIATIVPVIVWRSPCAVYASTALGVVLSVGFQAAFCALLYGMPTPEHRAGHYTFQILAYYASYAIGQVFVGFMCDKLDYRPAFIVLGVLALIMIPVSRLMLAPLSERHQDYS